MIKQISEYKFYRWRYLLGYCLISISLGLLLLLSILYSPAGVTNVEIETLLNTSLLSFNDMNPSYVINLPFSLLQVLSIKIFGITSIGIKLPSLLIGVLSMIAILALVSMWYRRNVALITALIVISTGQLLYMMQSGTADILYVFYPVWILLAASIISRGAKYLTIWKIIIFILAALSLYTPISIYLLITSLIILALHPHLRYVAKRLSRSRLTGAAIVAIILIAPLFYALYKQPSIALILLGVPSNWPILNDTLMMIIKQYIDFGSSQSGTIMTPIYGMGILSIIIIGLYDLYKNRHSARSYLVAGWLIILIPLVAINPNYIAILFLPSVILIAMGIYKILNYWYSLFPKNPYARVVGLIPITALIIGLTFSGVDRYIYGYRHSPNIAINFSQDIDLLNKLINNNDGLIIIVTADEKSLYDLIANNNDNISIVVGNIPTSDTTVVITNAAKKNTNTSIPLNSIITDSKSSNSDRFYVYKNVSK